MVTLAFAQAFYYLVEDNPRGLTGGDTGLALFSNRLPSFLSGAVSNTRNLYWMTLVFLVVAYVVVWIVTESRTGHVFVAIRENERRLEVMGVRSFPYKLTAFTLSAAVASTTVSLALLVMVVLGGAGTRWGAVTGAMIYIYLQQYLLKVANEPNFTTLPAYLRVPLSQPQFLLGAIFVLFVIFVPGGIAGVVARLRGQRSAPPHALGRLGRLLTRKEPHDTHR